MKERSHVENLAHASAKEWFRSRGVLNSSHEYQTTYAHYVRGYLNEIKRQEKNSAKP